MSDGNDNFWDPYCPCKVTRKNVVMTILTILCFALVFWTVIQTSFEEPIAPKSNITEVKIKASTPLEAIELITSNEIMVVYDGKNMTKAEKEQAKLKKAEEAYENFKLGIQLIRRNIKANLTEEGELCQCVCKLNVTLEEAKQALEFMLQDLHDKVEVKKQECDNPINITNVHWECPEKIVEPVPKEEEEASITPNTSQLLKTLK